MNPAFSNELRKLIKGDNEIFKEGHFKMTKGNHCQYYVQKDKMLTKPVIRDLAVVGLNTIAFDMKRLVSMEYFGVEKDICIASPSQAGIPWGAMVADSQKLPFVYCEKGINGMELKRGFNSTVKDKYVIIIEDIVSTAGSVRETAKAIHRNKGQIIVAVCIWNRGSILYSGIGEKHDHNSFSIESVIREELPMYKPDECPLCEKGIPIDNPKT